MPIPITGASQPANRAFHPFTSQGGHDRAVRYERSWAGDRQSPNAYQPLQSATDNGTGPSADCGALKRFGVLPAGKAYPDIERDVEVHPRLARVPPSS
jgi:hypothetical protein